MQGIILRGIGGFYYAMNAKGDVYPLRAQAKIRRERIKPVVGDRVEFTPGDGEECGWVVRILPRTNVLVRPPVANIDLIVIVVSAEAPAPDLMLVDRLLVNARRSGIDACLVITKTDLNPVSAEAIAAQYYNANVTPFLVSAYTNSGIDALKKALSGRVHTMAGQSGAGKSTLINALYGLQLETGGLSRKIERGKNTTRHAELIPVQNGGMVLDTPGFSLLETEVFDPVELKDSYPEFESYEGKCFFSPCSHTSEPKCAVLDAVHAEKLSTERHERYIELFHEIQQRWRDRYD